MDNNRNIVRILFPTFLAITLAIGFFLGGRQKDVVFLGSNASASNQSGLMKIDRVLQEIDLKYVDSVDKEELMEIAIESMLKELDPHTVYIPPKDVDFANERINGSFQGVGVRFMILDDTLFVTNVIPNGPSYFAGIKDGDRILRVDTNSIVNIGLTNQMVFDQLRGEAGSETNLEIFRPGHGLKTITVVRNQVPIKSVDAFYMLNNDVGYIKLSSFSRTTDKEFELASKLLLRQGMKKLIFDLRGNSGGILGAAISVSDQILPNNQLIVYTKGKSQPTREEFATDYLNLLEKTDVAIIIDNSSASASEIVAGAIQDNDRGTIYGRRSFGKGLVQEPINLSDGSELRLTISRYYTPTGRSIQKPYGEDVDYYDDLQQRIDAGEFYAVDSALLDSLPKYKTPKGKIVYGGGGIIPDVFIPVDSSGSSILLNQLFYEGIFNEFCFRYVDGRRPFFKTYSSVEDFAKRFSVNDDILTELTAFAKQRGLTVPKRELEQSKGRIKRRIKSSIANYLWQDKGLFYILSEEDSDIQRVLKDF